MNRSSPFIDRIAAGFWRRVAGSATVPAESLGIFRWVYGLLSLACVAPHCAWIDDIPAAFFFPPVLSPAYLFHHFPPRPFFLVLDLFSLACLCCVTVGYKTRLVTTMLLVANLVAANFRYSFGKIDHDILDYAILGCMIIGDWGHFHSVDALRRQGPSSSSQLSATRGVSLFAVLLTFGMVSAGLTKAYHWIDFNLATSGVLSWFLPNYYGLRRSLLLADSVPRSPRWLFEVGDYLAPVLELGGVFALLHSRRTWLSWIFAMSTFHLVNALTLNIQFNDFIILYLVFLNLAAVRDWIRVALPVAAKLRALPVAVGGIFAGWHVVSRLRQSGSTLVFVSDPVAAERYCIYLAVPFCLGCMGLIALELSKCYEGVRE